ncbi:MAG: TolB family protein [Actinomycetota bacterium]
MIVFGQGDPGGVFTMAPDGANQRQIRAASCCARVSPDGRRLVVTSFQGERPVPATLKPDGSGYNVLQLRDPTLQFNDPWAWSPHGDRIAGEGGEGANGPGPQAGIYTVSSSGELFQVDASPGRREFPIAWSPDGSRILFLRQVNRGEDYEGAMNPFVVNADGTGLTRLNPPGITSSLIDMPLVTTASWSPNGRRIAFTGSKEGSWFDSERAVFVVRADGTEPRRITPWSDTFSAMWSPDGRWIAFASLNPTRTDLFVVHPDGSGTAAVTSSEGDLFSFGPAWSPDSTRILFVRSPADFDTTDLWTAKVDGTELVQITHSAAGCNSYSWVTSPQRGS